MTARLADYDHAPGEHCGSTSLRNLASFYDWGFDEAECFGLGSGLGFTYFELPTDPWRMFVGRPLWLERAFFEHLDVPHTDREGDDWETAWTDVKARLDGEAGDASRGSSGRGSDGDGDPVMLFVDLYYLDYYDTDTHFAPHSLLAVGYDEAATAPDGSEGVVYLSDSEFDDLQALPLDSLRDAWAAKDVLPLQNRWLVAEGDPQADEREAVRTAVEETARYMLDPEAVSRETMAFGTVGVPGIRAFAEDLPSWTELEDSRWTARFAYQNVERRGTGGGAFRGLYAPFLDGVERRAGLDGFADRMHDIADAWTATSELLYEASETDDDERFRELLVEAADRVDAIADDEEAFFEDVLATLD